MGNEMGAHHKMWKKIIEIAMCQWNQKQEKGLRIELMGMENGNGKWEIETRMGNRYNHEYLNKPKPRQLKTQLSQQNIQDLKISY